MESQKQKTLVPWVIGVATGLYPIIFYYSNNYSLIDSWKHLAFFVSFYLCIPIVLFYIAHYIARKPFFKKVTAYIRPFLNLFLFFFYLKLSLFAGVKWGILLLILVLAAILSYFLYRHLKKIVQIQFVLAFIGLFSLIPAIYKYLNYSNQWKQQPDAIEQAIFTTKPNIYFIQPDGYANIEMLQSSIYDIDNRDFMTFLEANNFTTYPSFRNNYGATLASNSAVFMMRHHYYNKGTSFSETINAREVIVGDNSVLRILKHNGYTTSFIAQKPYFLVNRKELGYDTVNFSKNEISFISTGLEIEKDVTKALEKQLDNLPKKPLFTFIQILSPGHITRSSIDSGGVEGERLKYIKKLKESNVILTDMIANITKKDPKAIIVIMADHGGYVGLEYTKQVYTKTDDIALRESIFGSMLAIKWPDNRPPVFNSKIKTSVNLFRVITAYLSKNKAYLEHLENNNSYMILKKGVTPGIYEYLDGEGKLVLNKHIDAK